VYRRNPDNATFPEHADTNISDIFLVEVAMKHSVASPELDDLDGEDVPAETISMSPLEGPTRCQAGVEGSLDVLLPER
jgi:hypothetical protein